MKSDTERTKFYKEKIHKRKNRLHVHLSKELRGKLKVKKRSLLVHKGDTVRVMRGPEKGKEAKVGRVNVIMRTIFLEGITAKTAKGKEVPLAVQPSNLMLISLESTPERKLLFSDDAFKKKEMKKAEAKTEAAEAKTSEAKAEEVNSPAKMPHVQDAKNLKMDTDQKIR
ncbi:50S ribosomal protein L24 [Candidatus Bilamarchaeum dharawalense]|uniref:50S ribosomal protein L24 n=1 Tax=Candidatus Bilamarchaeum dharawalense TaxID=2885759 RepID=A0A5E4LRE4_9ARCH|nr:50S ribosomal protein L24 [Candidatus Bilamarchaeum dharawalense]